ncbi:MAG: FecR domain-containing protein, partial [Chthoniobacterales bacterium]
MKKFFLQITFLGLALGSALAGNLNQATITRVVKNVEVIPQGAQPKPANVGEVVRGGADVRTGEESRAQLTFADQTLARLGENTVFSFERGTRSLDLESGAILLEVPKDAGGATIRSAPVTAAITGTTVMMEYSPGSPGTVKLIVLEGTARLSLAGRLGESVLIGPGQMISLAANARTLPNPSTVDVQRLMRTSRLIKDGELEAMGLILETANAQQQMLRDGQLGEAQQNTGQQPNNPANIAANT